MYAIPELAHTVTDENHFLILLSFIQNEVTKLPKIILETYRKHSLKIFRGPPAVGDRAKTKIKFRSVRSARCSVSQPRKCLLAIFFFNIM